MWKRAIHHETRPTIVILGAITAERFLEAAEGMAALKKHARVGIGGVGATEAVAQTLGVELLASDLIGAASSLTP